MRYDMCTQKTQLRTRNIIRYKIEIKNGEKNNIKYCGTIKNDNYKLL